MHEAIAPALMTMEQARVYLCAPSTRTLDYYIRAGVLKPTFIGRCRFIAKTEADAFITRQTKGSRRDAPTAQNNADFSPARVLRNRKRA